MNEKRCKMQVTSGATRLGGIIGYRLQCKLKATSDSDYCRAHLKIHLDDERRKRREPRDYTVEVTVKHRVKVSAVTPEEAENMAAGTVRNLLGAELGNGAYIHSSFCRGGV